MKNKILKISIVGKTNAGKSTFINCIIGETISITNKKINTTEELILGILNIKEIQLMFYDTPGISNLKNINYNKNLKRNLWEGLNNSDLILYLIDVKKYNINDIKNNLKKLQELEKKIIIVFNKIDLIDKKIILPKIDELSLMFENISYFLISAKKKYGINYLKKYLVTQAYSSEWVYKINEITDKDDIFITNESTRNSILSLLHQEVPYNLKITNKLFKYLKNGDLKIKQEIEIKNNRYKKIIIGKNGEKIKEIRIRSQNNISKILNTKVHLYINISNFHAS